jgi:hypothetical protein
MVFARSISIRNFVEKNMAPFTTRSLVFAIVMGSGFFIAVEESLASHKADEFTAKDVYRPTLLYSAKFDQWFGYNVPNF